MNRLTEIMYLNGFTIDLFGNHACVNVLWCLGLLLLHYLNIQMCYMYLRKGEKNITVRTKLCSVIPYLKGFDKNK